MNVRPLSLNVRPSYRAREGDSRSRKSWQQWEARCRTEWHTGCGTLSGTLLPSGGVSQGQGEYYPGTGLRVVTATEGRVSPAMGVPRWSKQLSDRGVGGAGQQWSHRGVEVGGQQWSDSAVEERLQRLLGSTEASHSALVERLGALEVKLNVLQDLAQANRLRCMTAAALLKDSESTILAA